MHRSDRSSDRVVDAIFVPEGMEERVVREAVARAGAKIEIIPIGLGPTRAAEIVSRALYSSRIERALVTGVCGLLAPSFRPGETLLYADVRTASDPVCETDQRLTTALAAMLPRPRTGIRALSWSSVVTSAQEKGHLFGRFAADAIDMESYAALTVLRGAGIPTAVLRVGSDGAGDDLPEINWAVVGGVLDRNRLLLQMLRAPRAATAMAWNGMRALARLRDTITKVARG